MTAAVPIIASATGDAVSCQGLTREFPGGNGLSVMALRGVDLDIKESEMFFLAGPSGCGKTTLISIIAGLLTPSSGQCRVAGQDLVAMSNEENARFRAHHIGMLFQHYHLLPALPALNNVAVPLLIQGLPKEEAWERAHAALEEVGLSDRDQARPRSLSGRQQQRVAIARAVVHKPKLLLCDEPTSALDHDTGMKIMELLRNLNKETGMTLIVVTHDSRIFSFADRIARMDDGKIVEVYEPKRQEGMPHV